jgi:hypothetical protein
MAQSRHERGAARCDPGAGEALHTSYYMDFARALSPLRGDRMFHYDDTGDRARAGYPRWPALELFSLPLLLGGVSLMLMAIFLELLDLRKALATIELESGEVTAK